MLRRLLMVGGVLNLLLAAFHLGFPWIFHWKDTLASLPLDAQGLVYALNLHATLLIAAFGLLSVARPTALIETPLGRQVAGVIAAFYLLRAGEEWILFNAPLPVALFFFGLCMLLAGLYSVAAASGSRQWRRHAGSPSPG